MLISNCCSAPARGEGCTDIGICPDCGEHCEFIDEEDDVI
jgi:hypothetical protein